jgi:hypothetical protein
VDVDPISYKPNWLVGQNFYKPIRNFSSHGLSFAKKNAWVPVPVPRVPVPAGTRDNFAGIQRTFSMKIRYKKCKKVSFTMMKYPTTAVADLKR